MKEECSDDLRIKPFLMPERGDVFDLFIDDDPELDVHWMKQEAILSESDGKRRYTFKFKNPDSVDLKEFAEKLTNKKLIISSIEGVLKDPEIREEGYGIVVEWESETPEDNIHEDWNIAT